MPRAAPFLMNLNTVCYQALFKLFLQINKSVINFEDSLILEVYNDMEMYLGPVFVRMAVLPRDEEVREQALLHANLLLTSCQEPYPLLTEEFLRNLFALMEVAGDPSTHQSCLTVLRSCIEYGLKYSTLRRDPEELQLCTRQCMQKAKSDPQAAYYDLQNFFETNIASYAGKKNIQYIGHIHTGGVPGRHELDDTQELYYPAIMKALVTAGYKGFVGQEFTPTQPDKLDSLRKSVMICDV